MTVKEAAAVLALNPTTVYQLCATGRLGHRRIGLVKGSGRITITEQHIAAYLESCEIRPSEPVPKGGRAPARLDPDLRFDGKPFRHFKRKSPA